MINNFSVFSNRAIDLKVGETNTSNYLSLNFVEHLDSIIKLSDEIYQYSDLFNQQDKILPKECDQLRNRLICLSDRTSILCDLLGQPEKELSSRGRGHYSLLISSFKLVSVSNKLTKLLVSFRSHCLRLTPINSNFQIKIYSQILLLKQMCKKIEIESDQLLKQLLEDNQYHKKS